MIDDELVQKFCVLSSLPDEKSNRIIPVAPISDRPLYVGKSSDGRPMLLVKVIDDGFITPFDLDHIKTLPRCVVKIKIGASEPEEQVLSVIECLDTDPEIMRLFLELLGRAFPSGKSSIASIELDAVVNHLKQLFRLTADPSVEVLLGLWGELFVALRSTDPIAMLRAWHSEHNSHIDFATDQERIEVKTTQQTSRRHRFSLSQLDPPSGVCAVVVSVQTQKIDTGTSIQKLWDEATRAASCDDELRKKIDRLCLRILGVKAREHARISFSMTDARSSAQVHAVETVPRLLAAELPNGVDSVSFESDLSRSVPLQSEAAGEGIINALLHGLEGN